MINPRSLSMILAVGLAGFHAEAADLASVAPTRQGFEKLYAAIHVTNERKDRVGYASFLAPDFASEDTSGHVASKEDALAALEALSPDPIRKSHTTVLSVHSDGQTAAVTQRFRMTTKRPATGGRVESVELDALSDDTWVKTGSGWKISRTVTRQVDFIVDGRTVMHKVHQ
jgi:hypothetical protein